MGDTAIQEVATVLGAYSGLAPEGTFRSRATSELFEVFPRVDDGGTAPLDKGPDAVAHSALKFLCRLTESLKLVD